MSIFQDPIFFNAFLAAGAMGVTCAVLSVFVLARRWAFIGEGISHSGFGGAGTAWALAALFPQLHHPWIAQVTVFVFCLLTAVAIGYLTQRDRLTPDAAIGVFLVASLAWGFVGQAAYTQRYGQIPDDFTSFLWGQMKTISPAYALATAGLCGAVLLVTIGLRKEILAYCFDPMLARTSGVRAGLIHYTLLLMMALVIVLGIRVVGSVLMTALLVLPAATARLLTVKLRTVFALGITIALSGAWGGLFINRAVHWLPVGSMIVLVMFVEFVAALVVSKLKR